MDETVNDALVTLPADSLQHQDSTEARHIRVLYQVSQAVNSTLNLQDVLNLLMDQVIAVTGAQRGYLVLRNETTSELSVAVARGIAPESFDASMFSVSRSLITQVATTGQAVVATNAQLDPRFADMESVQNYGLRSLMCVPLIVRGQIIGVVYVDHRFQDSVFTAGQLALLSSISDHAAVAINNARTFGYLSNVLASIASGVVTVDPSGLITTFNRAAATIFGLQSEDIVGRPYHDIFGDVASSPISSLLKEAQHGGGMRLGYETTITITGRGETSLIVSIAPVSDDTGAQYGLVMVLEDITGRRRMERYLAAPVVQHLLMATEAPRLGGQLRQITILFGDVQGYTALSERLRPEQLLEVLNLHLSLAASTIMDAQFEGTLDKYIGDAVMGLFNAPFDQPDHAWRAVCAAWQMQARLRVLQRTLPIEQRLRFRIGIHTGEAVVGHIGSERLMNYTAVGDAVNVAKRLQERARAGQITLSEETFRAIPPQQRAQLLVRPIGFITVKGRTIQVPTYELFDFAASGG